MKIYIIAITFFLLKISNVLSAPGEISQVPLGLQNKVDSNLMFLLDSSGSMRWDVEQECETKIVCSSVQTCSSDKDFYCEGYYYGDEYWRNNGTYGFGEPYETLYNGRYRWGDRTYKNCTARQQKATCVSSRHFIMQKVATSLMDDIDDFYVGLMRFNSDVGGRLVNDLIHIDQEDSDNYSTRLGSLKQSIASIPASGSTPLAESLSNVGYYFSLNAPEAPTLTETIDDKYVLDTDTDDENYVFVPTEKVDPYKRAVLNIFEQMGGLSGFHWPTYNASGDNEEEKNEDMTVKGWCQKNFLITLTDGEPSNDTNIKDILKKYEQTGNTDFLADVAGALWDIDLRTDLCDPLLLEELNDQFGVNMQDCNDLLTTTVSPDEGDSLLAYRWLEKEYEETSDDNVVGNDSELHRYKNNIRNYFIGFASETVTNNSLLQDAARLGAGDYYPAKDEEELNAVFNAILRDIAAGKSSSSGVGLSLTLGQKDYLYRAKFNTSGWSGELGKYRLVRQVGQININDLDKSWSTDDADTFLPHDERLIFTWDPMTARGIPFKWQSLTDNHPLRADLSTGPNGNDDGLGEERLDYMRGDQSNEQGGENQINFRKRDKILGSIVHSTPKYVGPIAAGEVYNPNLDTPANLLSRWNYSIERWADGNIYTSPRRSKGVVYVNANDGMLHAFDDENGKELFAYMPSFIASTEQGEGLHQYVEKDYVHRFYNDATPYIDEDVWLESKGKWRTLLVSGTAAGGKGIFLLDVTAVGRQGFKESNARKIVLWEFTHPELGHTYSEPYIGPLRNGKWGVIIGNGYNSERGEASVFILHVEPDLSDGRWDEGIDFFILRTGKGQPNENQGFGKNGMSTVVAADIYQDPEKCSTDKAGLHHLLGDSCYTLADADNEEDKQRVSNYFTPGYGSIDRLYGGDLYGNLWAFNLMSDNPRDWSIDFEGKPLFEAPKDGDGNPQPITSPPRLIWMEPIIQRCDGKKTAILSRNGRSRPTPVGEVFGDSSVVPYESWNIDGITIPDAADEMNARHLTCGPNVLVMFGTGQFLTQNDVTDKSQRSFYAVWDNYKFKDYPLEIDDLDRRTFSTTLSVDDNKLRRQIADVDGIADGEFDTTQWHINNEFGWYVDFDQIGERVVSPPVYLPMTGEVFFTSIIPEDEACGAGGISIANRVDAINGTLSKNPRSNAIYVGTELYGLAKEVQLLGANDDDSSSGGTGDGGGPCEGDDCDPPPSNPCSADSGGASFGLTAGQNLSGLLLDNGPTAKCGPLSWYEIKQ